MTLTLTWAAKDVARYCGVSPSTARGWIRAGLLQVDENRRVPDAVLREVLQHGLPLNKQEAASVWPIPDMAEAQPYLAQEAA